MTRKQLLYGQTFLDSGHIVQGELFPDLLYTIKKSERSGRSYDILRLREEMNRHLNFTSGYQHPKVAAVTTTLAYPIIAYHRCSTLKNKQVCPHFYTDDSRYTVLLNQPNRAVSLLRPYPCALGPDFSVHAQMSSHERERRIYDNKFITAWLQYNGLTIYANIVWVERTPYELCFDGLPKNAVVAVNSTGIGNDRHAQYVWRDGYEAMLDILKPIHIIRYGARQEGEREDISTYFRNDNWRACNEW